MKQKLFYLQTKAPHTFSVDTEARAVYIGFSHNPVVKTDRKDASLFFDYDKEGNLVGIEIIRIQKGKATIKKVLQDTEQFLPASLINKINSYLQPSSA